MIFYAIFDDAQWKSKRGSISSLLIFQNFKQKKKNSLDTRLFINYTCKNRIQKSYLEFIS